MILIKLMDIGKYLVRLQLEMFCIIFNKVFTMKINHGGNKY